MLPVFDHVVTLGDLVQPISGRSHYGDNNEHDTSDRQA